MSLSFALLIWNDIIKLGSIAAILYLLATEGVQHLQVGDRGAEIWEKPRSLLSSLKYLELITPEFFLHEIDQPINIESSINEILYCEELNTVKTDTEALK